MRTVPGGADPKNSARLARVVQRLGNWADEIGRGEVAGPDGGFRLPTRWRRSPDATWFEGYPETKQRFPVFAPHFVIEVGSPEGFVLDLAGIIP